MQKNKIGVFDSGVGGLSVARAIQKSLPGYEVVYRDDAEHVPYGTKPIEEIHGFTRPILQKMADEGCRVIVIACNTVSTNLIDQLRQEEAVPLIGVEPMVKPAAQNTKTGVIAVCATRRTLASKRYRWLKEKYAQGVKVLEPECSDWILMIESSEVDHQRIREVVENACNQGADQIVLGCTHFHWVEDIVKEMAAGKASVIQPEEAVVGQLKRVLGQLA